MCSSDSKQLFKVVNGHDFTMNSFRIENIMKCLKKRKISRANQPYKETEKRWRERERQRETERLNDPNSNELCAFALEL